MRKYELATSLHFKYDRSGKIPLTNEIERLYNCGFKYLDFNFLDMCTHPESRFLRDDYLEWIRECKAFADSLGAKFVQAHAPCESIYEPGNYELLVELDKKAILGCAELGIPWMVYHPLRGSYGHDEEIVAFNLKHFASLLPLARDCKVGIAIENLVPQYGGHSAADIVDDQIYLIDKLDSEYVGAAWDTGHAHVCAAIEGAEEIAHQSVQLKKLGDRLKCTHIHDNNSRRFAGQGKMTSDKAQRAFAAYDEHIAPFAGDIDWADIIEGLDAIDYAHYFTYEAHHAANTVPDAIVNEQITQLYRIGQSILGMSRL